MDLGDLLLVFAGAAFELILLKISAYTVSLLVALRSPSVTVIDDRGLSARGHNSRCSQRLNRGRN